jgi:AbrB family transcriptional regulator (stage V sporulation protein T)
MKTSAVLPKYSYTHVDKHGRIVIPAEIRAELGLEPGTSVSLRVAEDGSLQVSTFRQSVKRVQELVRQRTGGRKGILDEFIAERRREAERD